MDINSNNNLIFEWIAEIDSKLGNFLPLKGGAALVDFPNHSNCGDSAIWLGEISYFQAHNIHLSYVCTIDNFDADELEQASPTGPIFLHGGGNFGDVWERHQIFREELLKRFPNRIVIQLPQTLHFENPANLARTCGVINSHPNFTLLVRDRKSLMFARQHFGCRSELCPDMAFYLGPIERLIAPQYEVLALLRTDKERARVTQEIDATDTLNLRIADWLDGDTPEAEIWKRTMRSFIPALGLGAWNRFNRRELFYRRLAKDRLNRGLQMVSSGSTIITDRLHAHIFSVLLNVPHVTLDNSYGKLSTFRETWTQKVPNAPMATGFKEALRLVRG